MPPLNNVPFFEKKIVHKKEHYSNFCTFEILSLPNVLEHYLRKYGNYLASSFRKYSGKCKLLMH